MKTFHLTIVLLLISTSITLSQTINPEILWATYFGSPDDDFTGSVTTDNEDNIYMLSTVKSGAPTTAGVHKTNYGGGTFDVMLTKFNKDGGLVWSTYFGGNGSDETYSYPKLMSDGAIVICGSTSSTVGIASIGAFKKNYAGNYDSFLAVFEPDGKLRWSTYFGGSGQETEPAINVDANDNIFIFGYSSSTFGISSDSAFQKINNGGDDGVLAKFDKTGKQIWSTYFGGAAHDYFWASKVDSDGNIYVGGTVGGSKLSTPGTFQTNYAGNGDGILVKFDQNGQRIWSSYFGAGGKDEIYNLNIDSKHNIYISGSTTSKDGIATIGAFSTTNSGKQDMFLAKFDNQGKRLWSTFIGGDGWDTGLSCDIDKDDNIYLSIMTQSQTFPATEDVPMPYYGGGLWDAAFVKFSPDGVIKWSTFFGGEGNDRAIGIAIDKSQNIIATINTDSNGLATFGAYDEVANGNESLIIKLKDATTVDINEVVLMPNIKVFPNPTSHHMEIPNNPAEIRNINIYNPAGELVRSYVHTYKESFDIADLTAGLYYVVVNSKGISAATKLIKID